MHSFEGVAPLTLAAAQNDVHLLRDQMQTGKYSGALFDFILFCRSFGTTIQVAQINIDRGASTSWSGWFQTFVVFALAAVLLAAALQRQRGVQGLPAEFEM